MKTSKEKPVKYLEDVKQYYDTAYRFFTSGKYQEAEEVFLLLTVLDTMKVDHWFGLGASLQMQKKFKEAVDAYGAAALLDTQEKNPLPHTHAAECLWELNELEKAFIAVKSALIIAEKDKKHHALIEKLQLLNKRWVNE